MRFAMFWSAGKMEIIGWGGVATRHVTQPRLTAFVCDEGTIQDPNSPLGLSGLQAFETY
jgi:hypothetical protein